jgi:hypothetical protein
MTNSTFQAVSWEGRPCLPSGPYREPLKASARLGIFMLFHRQTLGTRERRGVSASHGQPIFLKANFLKGETIVGRAQQHIVSA